jgi:hypothetical protein
VILEEARQDILKAQADIINIPIQNGFSPTRWRTVVNAMLEKITGKPLLHKLRVIHILEADYNLALKEIFGRRLLRNCEKHGVLGDMQDGFRKGRSTIRTLLHNELINDYNRRLRINNFIGMTDISGCFDRIVAPVISLLNIKNGCPPAAVKMHATTLERARYHLKTKDGISTSHYQHSQETPVHGNGQGAGDSPSQWCQQSAMLFDLYADSNIGTNMSTRAGKHGVFLPMAAFADDTNLLGNDDTREQTIDSLIELSQDSFTTWNELLHATGHFMELEKCACYLSIWAFQPDGYAYTLSPEEISKRIIVHDLNGETKEIQKLAADTSQKLLGVMRNPIGNQQDEIRRLQTKSNNIATRINSSALTTLQAKMAYESFYIPAMRYSLAITSINQMDLDTIQRKAIIAILASMGYNRHMPREVAYCSTKYQGLGLKHLYDLQGSDGTRLLLQELNQEGTTNAMLLCTLDAIQMEAGIGRPILEDNRPLEYIEWGWIPSIRDFLLHINASIINATPKPTIFRQHDQYIMDAEILPKLSRKEQILINRCRLFLQIECISDISNAEGTKILPEWLDGNQPKDSHSTKNWPIQGDPGAEAWRKWKQFIERQFTTTNLMLRKKLGGWLRQNTYRHHLAYYHYSHQRLWLYYDKERWSIHENQTKSRRQCTFEKHFKMLCPKIPYDALPIDVINQTEDTYITGPTPQQTRTMNITQERDMFTQRIAIHSDHTLFHDVQLKVTEQDIRDSFEYRTYIDVATDGSYDQGSGKMSYGWVIALNNTVIATGCGPAESHPSLAEPFRAETYALAAAAAFIEQMLEHFRITANDHVWHFIMDNTSLIREMEHLRLEARTAKWNLRQDADILHLANKLLLDIPANFTHIKSHQDRVKTDKPLSFQAQLNIMADELATRQREKMTAPRTQVTTPFKHLIIDGVNITRDSQKWLLDTASRIPIQQYYYEKHKWNSSTFQNINWSAQQTVLSRYEVNDQRRILKFVHGWLPTYDRLYRAKQSPTQRCPLCHFLLETNLHLFQCRHPSQQEIVQTMYQELGNDKEMGKHEVTKIIMEQLQHHSNTTGTSPPESANATVVKFIRQQDTIGWKHIFFGRIANSMKEITQPGTTEPQTTNTGLRWTKRIIQHIWDTFLQLWANRNNFLYNDQQTTTKTRQKERLVERVKHCFRQQYEVNINDRKKIFYKEEEQIMKEDPRFIKAWLKLSERIIRTNKIEAKNIRRERVLMEQYFKWHPPTQRPKKRRKISGSHQKQDLKPD